VPRWTQTKADYILKQAPESLKTSSGKTTKEMVMAYSDLNPAMLISLLTDKEEMEDMVGVHSKWDPPGLPHIVKWLLVAEALGLYEVIDKRVEENPNETITIRLAMDKDDESKAKICERYQQKL